MTPAHLHDVRAQGNIGARFLSKKPGQGPEQGKALALVVDSQAFERSEERRNQHEAFYAFLDKLPFEVEAAQMRVIWKLLARDPLELKRAEALAICPPLRSPHSSGYKRFYCKRFKLCNYCPERRATKQAGALIEAATSFKAPCAVLLTCPTAGLLGLGLEITRMRRALRRITRLAWFAKVVKAGVLAFECPLGKGARHWHLHAHGVVDAAGLTPAFETRCNREWKASTGNARARFGFEPVRSVPSLVSYALKLGDRPSSWAPALGAMTDEQRARLDQALTGRRMTASWRAR